MTDVSDNNRFAPPRAELTHPDDPASGPVPGGRWARLGAAFVDGLFGWAVIMAVNLVTGESVATVFRASHGGDASVLAMMTLMFQHLAPAYAIIVAVQAWFFHSGGHTIGKKALGLRIVRADGSRAGFARLFFLRAGLTIVLSMIPLLGSLFALVDILMIFSASRRCLHDLYADTIVVTSGSSMGATRA